MKIKSALSGAALAACALATVFAIAGCSSPAPKPVSSLARAKSAVDQATTANAQQYAAVDLNNAQTKLMSANEAETKGDYKQARYLAEEAQVDAQLALAKTQAAKAKNAAQQLRESNQTLQNQVNQPGNQVAPPPSTGIPPSAANLPHPMLR